MNFRYPNINGGTVQERLAQIERHLYGLTNDLNYAVGEQSGTEAAEGTTSGEEGSGWYDGTYTVTPAVKETTLPTAQKRMRSDVTIHRIPIYKVSNQAGGKTVYIAGPDEIEIN